MEPTVPDVEEVLARFNRNLRTYGVRVALDGVDGGTLALRLDRPSEAGVCSSGCDLPLPALVLALEQALGTVAGVTELRWRAGAVDAGATSR